jgi:hypothetical protein
LEDNLVVIPEIPEIIKIIRTKVGLEIIKVKTLIIKIMKEDLPISKIIRKLIIRKYIRL